MFKAPRIGPSLEQGAKITDGTAREGLQKVGAVQGTEIVQNPARIVGEATGIGERGAECIREHTSINVLDEAGIGEEGTLVIDGRLRIRQRL